MRDAAGIITEPAAKTGINQAALISAAVLLLSFAAIPASANPAAEANSPKQRIEREFRQLESTLASDMQSQLLRAIDMEQLNQKLFDFMLEHPGVVRLLRVNAGGFSVNDVSAGSARSAPPRNIGGQRWFQLVAQNKQPYYSMDADSITGAVSLFYAQPVFTGPGRDVFSGTLAAMIDFTAVAALIEDIAPYQVAYNGRAFFQHEWDGTDYNEEPLSIRGTQGLTIRTMKPLRTRLDPLERSAQTASKTATTEKVEEYDDDDDDNSLAEPSLTPARKKRAQGNTPDITNITILALLILIALMLAYSILRDRSKRFSRDERAPREREPPEESVVIVKSLAGKSKKLALDKKTEPLEAIPPQEPQPDVLDELADDTDYEKFAHVATDERFVDTIIMDPVIDRKDTEMSKDQQAVIAKMLKLIREEFVIMDHKMQILMARIEELEKNKK